MTEKRKDGGLPSVEQIINLDIDSILIALKEGVIQRRDLQPNIVQKIHEQHPRPPMDVHEITDRQREMYELAATLEAYLFPDLS